MQGELRTESHEYMGRGGRGQRGREGEKGNSVMYIQVYIRRVSQKRRPAA